MRQRELTESNAKILDLVMETVSNKKKIPMPQIQISDCRPYTVLPQGVIETSIPYTNPDSIGVPPFAPYKEIEKDKPTSTLGKKELTPVEEVEEYLRMEVARERAAKNKKKKEQYFTFPTSLSSLYLKPIPHNKIKFLSKNLMFNCVCV